VLFSNCNSYLDHHEKHEAHPPRSSGRGSFLFRAMCQKLRALWIFVLPLLIVLVTPSAFAQSWVSSVTVTTTNTTATIHWTTAVPATSRVKYGLTTSYGTLSGLNSNRTTAHSVSLTALIAGTTYHCRVLSADATGVQVTGLDYTFTTLTGPVTVSVSPTTATVVSGGSQRFSAQVTNTTNTAVMIGHCWHREQHRIV